MRLDADLIKGILLKVEDMPGNTFLELSDLQMEGYSEDQIRYHLRKLHEAGYVKIQSYIGGDIDIEDLTWEGHHFLATLRDENLMKKVGKVLERYGLPLLPELIKALIPQL
jgi:repressor of nif and glnA expression